VLFPLRFLGYGVRRTAVPAGWTAGDRWPVEEICSVSDCIATRPDGWVERWDYNGACCYESADAALETRKGDAAFRLLAYAFVAMKLNDGGELVTVDVDTLLPAGPRDLPSTGVPDGLVSIGYDVVSKQGGASMMDFECSPLSCCMLAAEVPVNRNCLIDDLDEALRLAQKWDREEPEPGPYYLVQVLEPT
jgi:hypothetical protein